MIEVEAVKDTETILQIEKLLEKHYSLQMAQIWSVGIQLALRITDLLSLQWSDVDLKRQRINITELKTGKSANIKLNAKAVAILTAMKTAHPGSIYVFESRLSRNRLNAAPSPLTRQAVAQAFKAVGAIVGVQLSTHSMRKTRGYHLYTQSDRNIALVMKMLRHSSESETLRYIGMTQETVDRSFEDLIL